MQRIHTSFSIFAAGALAAMLCLSGCSTASAPAPEKAAANAQPEYRSLVTINDIMVDVIDHNSHAIWNVADPKMAPKTDQDWHYLDHAAVTVAASGNMLLIPGPAPDDQVWVKDPAWSKLSQDQTNAAMKAVNAIAQRDLKALEAAGDDLVVSCEECHKKFKPSLPGHVAKPAEQPEHYHKDSKK